MFAQCSHNLNKVLKLIFLLLLTCYFKIEHCNNFIESMDSLCIICANFSRWNTMNVVDIAVPETHTVGKPNSRVSTSKNATVTSIHQKKKMIAFENAKKNLKKAASKLDW